MLPKFNLLYETLQTEPFELANAGLADKLAGIKFDLDIANDTENDDLLNDLDPENGFEDELDDEIVYTAEMVNVTEEKFKGKPIYCVEADSILKFMHANDIEVGDIGSAIAAVAAANGVEVNNIAIVMESNLSFKRLIVEAKQDKGGKSLSLLDTFAKLAKNAKNAGIKVVKKTSFKKKK